MLNRHGRLVFPSNFEGQLDFSALETVEQLTAVVERDFAAKAPTGTEVLERATSGGYGSRADLLRDLVLYLFWSNRFAMTMYEKHPMRWRDVHRQGHEALPGGSHQLPERLLHPRRERALWARDACSAD